MTKSELIETFFTGRALKFRPSDPDVPLSPGVIARQALAEALENVIPEDAEIHDGIECSPTTWLLVLDAEVVAISASLEGDAVKIVVAFTAVSDLAPVTEWHYQLAADQRVYLSRMHIKGLPFPLTSTRDSLTANRLNLFFRSVHAAQRRIG